MSDTAIELRGVHRAFELADGRAVRALDGVDLAVSSGSVTVLTGPSGSGKTTLLNVVAGLDRPTAGSVEVLGSSLDGLSEDAVTRWRRRSVASIFQAKGLVTHLTALENVDLALRLVGVGDRRERVERSADALDVVGLGDHRAHRPGQLSGGQQQRVAIARALVVEAPLLVADEPTGELDSDTSLAMIELIIADVGRRGATALITTHDQTFRSLAHRAVALVDGRLA